MDIDKIVEVAGDAIFFAGLMFAARGAKDLPLDEIIPQLPFGNLTPEQRKTIEDIKAHPGLMEIADQWWDVYNLSRDYGDVSAASPWFD